MRTLPSQFVSFVLIIAPQIASALIVGSEGNEELNDSHMPNGANAIINRVDRIAWWEGDDDPFHADGRGDTKVMRAIVSDFAKLDFKTKRIVVHDGIGQSYLLNMDNHCGMIDAARIDWTFSVWREGSWESSRGMFARPNQLPSEKPDLSAQLDVYTANIRWAEVVVPAGIQVIDERVMSAALE